MIAGPYFALVLLLQVLALYEHVVEKPDTWRWWVLICTQTSNELETFFSQLMIYGTLQYDWTQFSDMLHCKWLFIQVFWHSMTRCLFATVQVPFLHNENADGFLFVCSGVWIQCESDGRTECSSESSGSTVYASVYVSTCLLSAETAGHSNANSYKISFLVLECYCGKKKKK